MLLTEYEDDQKNWVSGRMHVRKRKRSLFPGIHKSNKFSLHLNVTEAARSETEPLSVLQQYSVLWIQSRQVKTAPEYNEETYLKEAPPSGGDRENCTTGLSDLFLLIIACRGTYRRMGQDPKKRVLNISVLREIVYYYFHNFLHGTGISSFSRIPSYNF